MDIAKKYNQRGFTLLELMIVMVVLGGLIAIIAPRLGERWKKAQIRSAKLHMKQISSDLDLYKIHVGKYPGKLRDLIKPPADERDKKRWEGPYLKEKEIPEDPWGEKYRYELTPGQAQPYKLYSYGPNRKGSPESEHISVWDE